QPRRSEKAPLHAECDAAFANQCAIGRAAEKGIGKGEHHAFMHLAISIRMALVGNEAEYPLARLVHALEEGAEMRFKRIVKIAFPPALRRGDINGRGERGSHAPFGSLIA